MMIAFCKRNVLDLLQWLAVSSASIAAISKSWELTTLEWTFGEERISKYHSGFVFLFIFPLANNFNCNFWVSGSKRPDRTIICHKFTSIFGKWLCKVLPTSYRMRIILLFSDLAMRRPSGDPPLFSCGPCLPKDVTSRLPRKIQWQNFE